MFSTYQERAGLGDPGPDNGTSVQWHGNWSRSTKKLTPRQQSDMLFHHGGWRICSKTFEKLHGIGMTSTCKGGGNTQKKVLIPLLISGRRHISLSQVSPRGYTSRLSVYLIMLYFLLRYRISSASWITMPRHMPFFCLVVSLVTRDDIQLLPTCTTKNLVLGMSCTSIMNNGL